MQLKIENLTHIYSEGLAYETKAVDNFSAVIESGEFVALIGHTGSGKTTLVQSISGLLPPTSGRVVSVDENGKETVISQKGKESFAVRRKVGIVFQYPEYQLFEETVIKDVCFGPKNQGLGEEEQLARAREALALVGINPEKENESPFDLSGGQKRRVAIAGVLAMNPEVLILDEPTAGLDPKGHDDILSMVRRIRSEKDMTIILVSHNMDDVAEYAERVIVLKNGAAVADGTPREVYCNNAEAVRDAGLDLPQGPAFLWKLEEKGIELDKDKLTLEETAEEILRVLKK